MITRRVRQPPPGAITALAAARQGRRITRLLPGSVPGCAGYNTGDGYGAGVHLGPGWRNRLRRAGAGGGRGCRDRAGRTPGPVGWTPPGARLDPGRPGRAAGGGAVYGGAVGGRRDT